MISNVHLTTVGRNGVPQQFEFDWDDGIRYTVTLGEKGAGKTHIWTIEGGAKSFSLESSIETPVMQFVFTGKDGSQRTWLVDTSTVSETSFDAPTWVTRGDGVVDWYGHFDFSTGEFVADDPFPTDGALDPSTFYPNEMAILRDAGTVLSGPMGTIQGQFSSRLAQLGLSIDETTPFRFWKLNPTKSAVKAILAGEIAMWVAILTPGATLFVIGIGFAGAAAASIAMDLADEVFDTSSGGGGDTSGGSVAGGESTGGGGGGENKDDDGIPKEE